MKNTLQQLIDEYNNLIMMCDSEINDPVTLSLEMYAKGKKKAYQRIVNTLIGLSNKAQENDYLRAQMNKLLAENGALKLALKVYER